MFTDVLISVGVVLMGDKFTILEDVGVQKCAFSLFKKLSHNIMTYQLHRCSFGRIGHSCADIWVSTVYFQDEVSWLPLQVLPST